MKNKKLWLGILFSLMLIFAKTGIAYAQSTGGTFTLSDIPARFNGKFALLFGYNQRVDLIGAQSYNMDRDIGSLPRITNGSVSIPMWILIDDGLTEDLMRYNGNHTVEIEIVFFNSATLDWTEDEIAYVYFESITFSNGSAAVSFHDNDDFDAE